MTTISSDLMTSMANASAAAGAGGVGGAAKPAGSLNDNSPEAIQDRFLKLLTVQMKNQDPTNPMDNSQLTTQLAQLSTVSGISKLNTTLASLQSNMSSAQSLQSADMIGHSVLAPGNNLNLSTSATTNGDGTINTSQKAVFGVQLSGAVDSLKVNIRDASGKVVQSMDLGAQAAGTLPVVWDGATDSGAKVPDGAYTFDVTASSSGETVGAKALTFGTVSSVSTNSDGVKLNVTNIGTIKPTEVIQIL